jgi:DNA invertase Pin-like site-specific DNA recombinase
MKVGYCRVSNKEQAVDQNALKQQIARIESQNIQRLYVDIESGRTEKRKEYQRLLADIEKGEVTELVITRMDRLIRNLLKQLNLISIFEEKKIKLIVLDQHVDLTTASGKLTTNILGAFSQNYSDDLSERIKHGFSYQRKMKKVNRISFGYKIVDTKIELDLDPFVCTIADKKEYSRYDIARLIICFFLGEKSFGRCLKKLNAYFGLSKLNSQSLKHHKSLHFSSAGLKIIITHPTWRGHIVYFHKDKTRPATYHFNNHTPILTNTEYTEIQHIITHNKKVRGFGVSSKNIFTGYVVCQNCGSTMSAMATRTNIAYNQYYHCQQVYLNVCSVRKCIRIEKITAALFSCLQSKYHELITLTHAPIENTKSKETNSLLLQIESLELLPKNSAIDKAIEEIRSQISKLEYLRNDTTQQDEDYLKALFSSTSFWETLLPHQLKEIVHKLVDKILILDGDVIEIQLKL